MTNTEIASASKIMLGTTEAVAMYIGSTQIWEAQTTPVGPLPAGYTELEYISSTQSNGEYIDLNIKLYETLNTDYDIALKFNIKGNGKDSNSQGTLFNCQDPNNNPWPGTFIRINQSKVRGRYIGGSSKDNDFANLNTITELPVQTSPNKNVKNINNNNKTHLYGTSLFCAFMDTSNTPSRCVYADLYYFKLFVNGTLVRDLIPCKDNNNVVGMYDVVNNTFYTTPRGAFIAGPEV